jgi:hypothetical protein
LIVAEKNATKNILDGQKDGQTEVKQYTPLLLRGIISSCKSNYCTITIMTAPIYNGENIVQQIMA